MSSSNYNDGTVMDLVIWRFEVGIQLKDKFKMTVGHSLIGQLPMCADGFLLLGYVERQSSPMWPLNMVP
jgi:hypothetical protein